MNGEPIEVECYSGYRANERPVALTLGGRRVRIRQILDRWYEGGADPSRPRIDYFKVETEEGRILIIRYLSLFDAWSLVAGTAP